MSFKSVKTYLLENLLPALSPEVQKNARTWIERLDSDDESDLLGCCVAVDFASGSLSSDLFDAIFKVLGETYDSPRRAFAEAVSGCPEDVQLRSQHRSNAEASGEVYANVLDMTSFLKSYVIPSYQHLTVDDLEQAKAVFFGSESFAEDLEERTLEEITRPYVAPDGLVWVGPDEAYRQGKNDLDAATASRLHDSLGLGEPWRGEMVYVRYPQGFDPGACCQPSCLDRGWEKAGGGYLSAAEGDGWGRTYRRFGGGERDESIPERVHGPIERLNEEFTARMLAEPEIEARDLETLRQEALRRFGGAIERADAGDDQPRT